LVFPNPVPQNFAGTIAIKGLVNNANVKIVEPNGRLVFETRALGGQAIWNGKNYKGEKVASGVYLVFIKDDFGVEKAVTKIFMLSGK
jgi:flagellar hook assembly protein FlgD